MIHIRFRTTGGIADLQPPSAGLHRMHNMDAAIWPTSRLLAIPMPATEPLPAFIISLYSAEHPRNRQLLAILGESGFSARIVAGVRGREIPAGEYFDQIQRYWRRRSIAMTPSEVGCSLSHTLIHATIVEEGLPGALVLEDDALLDSNSLTQLQEILRRNLHCEGLVLLGGQEGLEHLVRLAHGKRLDFQHEVWEVASDDLRHILRSVAYVISAEGAASLLELAREGAFVVDDYTFILEHSRIRRVFLSNCVGHPTDITSSSIESERAKVRWTVSSGGRPLWLRLMEEIQRTISARRYFHQYLRRIKGLDQINWNSRFSVRSATEEMISHDLTPKT